MRAGVVERRMPMTHVGTAVLVLVDLNPAGQSAWLEARTSDLAEFLADALRAIAIRTAAA